MLKPDECRLKRRQPAVDRDPTDDELVSIAALKATSLETILRPCPNSPPLERVAQGLPVGGECRGGLRAAGDECVLTSKHPAASSFGIAIAEESLREPGGQATLEGLHSPTSSLADASSVSAVTYLSADRCTGPREASTASVGELPLTKWLW